MAKKSAARAKPAREAAQTVRAAPASAKGKPAVGRKANPAMMSKEEKKEYRRQQRDEEDRLSICTNIMLRSDEEYKKRRRLWWVLLVAGLGMTALSWVCMFVIPSASSDLSTPAGMAAMVSLVLAYVGIIGAFIFDFVRIRPLRNKMEAAAKGLTEKKRQAIIDEDYAEAERRRVEKEARKQAKRSK
ncbi:MAG: hypothetical protein LKI25_05660 [Atopobiaceae bacterium]|nr:hypothetical protein [Atopobiaceae bacterium]MCI2173685.1 hypothetical protein [Atopobiaceae bacterium]MCI2207673.1 hypothetical protein [Atopobiaceae bacterium]